MLAKKLIDGFVFRRNLARALPLFLIFALAVFSAFYLKPEITGFIVVGKEINYTDAVNLVVGSDREYYWFLEHPGDLKSVRLDGSITTNGTARVYLEHNNRTYLVFDSGLLDKSGNLATGFAVLNETAANETNQTEANAANQAMANESQPASNETGQTGNQTAAETEQPQAEKTITISIAYNSGSAFDADNNGIETTTGAIDFTALDTDFSWEVDESKLCTRWSTYSLDSGGSAAVCYGNSDCCAFAGLASERDSWNEMFYSSYGRYGATLSNAISAQIIYYDVSLDPNEPYAYIYYSNWSGLNATYYFEETSFSGVCTETCLLSGLNEGFYKLIIDVDNAVLTIDKIEYSILNATNITEEENITIELKDKKGKKLGHYKLNKTDEGHDLELDSLPEKAKRKGSEVKIKNIRNLNQLKKLEAYIDETLDDEIKTDVFAAADGLIIDNAEITLAKKGNVNAIVKCADFNFETFSCDNWQRTSIPFTETADTITFTVTEFNTYAGAEIEIINVHSYPSLYGNWTVMFNTTGTANLTVTATYDPSYAQEITRWSNENEDSSLYDLRFLEVRCGNEAKQYGWQGVNCFEQECSVFIAGYSCNETGYEISKVLTAKKHVLKFSFGGQTAYAYNDVGNESSESGTDEWRMFGRYLNQTRYTNSAAPTNLANAKIITFSAGAIVQSSPAVANGYVYVGSDDAKLYQLNASNISQQVASFSAAGAIYSSPAVAGDYVYVLNYNTVLYQLNASNVSRLIANFSTGGGFYNSQSSPAVANGYVYVGSSLGGLYQLNASNVSQKIANFSAGDAIYPVPAIANGFVYAGSNDANLYQLNASNVSQKIASFSAGVFYSSAAVANGFVYVGNDDGNLYQLNASNVSQKIANFSTGDAIRSSPAVANGFVYVGSNSNKTYQLNATNVSQLIANYTTNGNFQSSPAVTDSYVFIGSYDNKTYQLNATNISILVSTYTTGGSIHSSPAIAGGSVYVGSNDWRLYQFVLDTTPPSISFTNPTPANGTTTTNTSVQINISITNADDLSEMKWNWNGTNYTFYNNSLVLMFNFDNVSALGEGNNNLTKDVSKYNNNGTCVGMGAGCNWTTGKYGSALSFDGVDDYVNITHSASLNLTDAITISAWINSRDVQSRNNIIVDKTSTWTTNGGPFRLMGVDGGQAHFYIYGSSLISATTGNNNLTNNNWHFIVGTYDKTNIKVYVDGVEKASSSASIAIPTNTQPVRIGRQPEAVTDIFNGTIDEVRIWNRSLTAAEIKQHYYSNLYKYATDKWAFYSNQSNLSVATYNYSGCAKDISGNENCTETRILTIQTAQIPNITQVRCYNGTAWIACLNMSYGINLTQIRVNCTDPDGDITNVTYLLRNIDDNAVKINASYTTNDGDFYYYNYSQLIQDSGNWTLNITCIDATSLQANYSENWSLAWGVLVPYIVTEDRDVAFNVSFNFTVGVNCTIGECGSLNATLDPEELSRLVKEYHETNIQSNTNDISGYGVIEGKAAIEKKRNPMDWIYFYVIDLSNPPPLKIDYLVNSSYNPFSEFMSYLENKMSEIQRISEHAQEPPDVVLDNSGGQ